MPSHDSQGEREEGTSEHRLPAESGKSSSHTGSELGISQAQAAQPDDGRR
jgi:hypothetical protein